MSVSVRKRIGLVRFGLAVALAGLRSAQAEATHPAFSYATPEAAIASASSPSSFAHIASQSRLAIAGFAAVGPENPAHLREGNAHLPDVSTSALPEAPGSSGSASASLDLPTAGHAPHYTKYIPAGWSADKINARDKIIVGARDLYSPLNFLAMAASAGYSDITDGQPNYGTDGTAFGKRFGAAAIRETSQGVFTDMVFAPLLHQDPRYFIEGSQYGFIHRTLYSITRPLVTRTDGGHSTVNASLLLGYAAAAALTPAYYPQSNRNFHDVAATYGGSIGGAALGFFVTEFADDLLKAVHMKK